MYTSDTHMVYNACKDHNKHLWVASTPKVKATHQRQKCGLKPDWIKGV